MIETHTFDEICESQDFGHEERFVKYVDYKKMRDTLVRIANYKTEEKTYIVKSYLDVLNIAKEAIGDECIDSCDSQNI